MDATDCSAPAHPSTDHDDTIEAHYASLERGIPCAPATAAWFTSATFSKAKKQSEAVSELDAETFCEMLEPAGTPREG